MLETERPDVAFLDIRMPGLSGLEVAAELADRFNAGERVPRLVFITAYDEFALKAFDLAAVDYLLKPVATDRLERTVGRLKAQLAADKYTSVVTRDAELLIRTPLKDLLAQLPQERFRQIHRGTIVNLAEVATANRDESGRISLRLKNREESLPVSRVYEGLFRPQ